MDGLLDRTFEGCHTAPHPAEQTFWVQKLLQSHSYRVPHDGEESPFEEDAELG